jgi:N-acetylglucosaminyldiphosphoundecaprenol N-acetyl-beta-D-mannosaminyltransferase
MSKSLAVETLQQVNVLGVGVHVLDMESTTSALADRLREGTKGYVCLAGVHGVMEAQRDPDLKAVFAKAFLVVPDGMPTVWMGHLQGFPTMQRVFGPDLMLEVMGRKEFRHCRHFLCGGEMGVAERLRDEMVRRFPWVKITGVYSPPFRAMTEIEESELAAQVHCAKPDIIWVGISTPKQDRFMARYLSTLDTKLMIGVGAAFLFHTGEIKDSPKLIKQAGLQWLHRLVQEPSRLWRRYLLNNPRFLLYAFFQVLGLKRYALRASGHSRSYV